MIAAIIDGKVLVLVLQEENLRRMKDGDPISFHLDEYLPGAPPIEILIGTIADDVKLATSQELLQHVTRGWHTTPDDGHKPIPIMKGKTTA